MNNVSFRKGRSVYDFLFTQISYIMLLWLIINCCQSGRRGVAIMFFHSLEKTVLLEVKYFSKICYTENSKAVYLVVLLSLHFEIPRECHVDFIDCGQ
jgi:hypothetical protein